MKKHPAAPVAHVIRRGRHPTFVRLLATLVTGFFATLPSVASTVSLDFDATYTSNMFFAPAITPRTPIRTKLHFDFQLNPQSLVANGLNTDLILATGAGMVKGDSPIFPQLPAPQIQWKDSDQGQLYIRRNTDSAYQLVAALSGGYQTGCPHNCNYYSKGISLVSLSTTPVGFDPFIEPLRFINFLAVSNTTFESSLYQQLMTRSGKSQIVEGASLWTSNGSNGYGELFNGGGAQLTAVSVSTVPNPATAWLIVSGLGVVGAAARRRR